jgi:hypothetical protein
MGVRNSELISSQKLKTPNRFSCLNKSTRFKVRNRIKLIYELDINHENC